MYQNVIMKSDKLVSRGIMSTADRSGGSFFLQKESSHEPSTGGYDLSLVANGSTSACYGACWDGDI
jgi:hypothetical protein